MRFFAGARGEFLRVEGANVGGVGFGPARGGAFLNGNGKFGMRFAIGGKEAAGISECGLALAVGIDSGGDLAILDGQITGAADRASAFFCGESGGRVDKTADTCITRVRGAGEKTRVLRG